MVAELILVTSILLSTMFPGVRGYLGEDMDDEDFALFVDTHYDMIEPVVDFVDDHKEMFVRGVSGLASTVGASKLPISPVLKMIIGAGGSEVGKNVWDEVSGESASKEKRLEKMEKQLEDALEEIKSLKEKLGDPVEDEQSLLEFNDCRGGVDGSYRQEHYSNHRDTERRHHMTESFRHTRDNFHRTPSERRYERMHPEKRYERERNKEFGLDNDERAYA